MAEPVWGWMGNMDCKCWWIGLPPEGVAEVTDDAPGLVLEGEWTPLPPVELCWVPALRARIELVGV